jgi:hypothetical protein
MNMGTGFVVTVPSRDSEKRLLTLLAARRDNYPIVCRRPPNYLPVSPSDYPLQYLVTSLDGPSLP